MYITKIEQIYKFLKHKDKQNLIAVWANDKHTIVAVSKAIDMNIVNGILIGNKDIIESICLTEKINIDKFEILNVGSDIEAGELAVQLIIDKKGDVLMKGLISTDKYIKAILNKRTEMLHPDTILSSIAVIENSHYHKLLIVGDVAIIPQPDIEKKIAIIHYLVNTAKALGISKPKLSIISATEQIIPKLQSSIEANTISNINKKNKIEDAFIEGPLSLDISINKDIAKLKGVNNEVAGDADCLLFPNLDTGNMFYKMNSKMSSAKIGTFVLGAKVPCVLSSRGDSIDTKLNSIALCVLLSLQEN
jgi:phosphate butyryltransferase